MSENTRNSGGITGSNKVMPEWRKDGEGLQEKVQTASGYRRLLSVLAPLLKRHEDEV
jgi:hypothetical protein